MRDELISVIVPIYNNEKYLNKCIESIISQTYRDLEIILIDDGSTDDSLDICREWEKRDNRITVIHIKNSGVSNARNTGLELASGKYITFADSDDYISQNMYEIMYKNMIKNDADIVECSYCNVYKDKVDFGIGADKYFIADNYEAVKMCLRMDIVFPSIWNKLYKKECLRGLKFNTQFKISEDKLFNYYATTRCKKYVHIGECLYYYVQNELSALHSVNKDNKINLDTYNVHKIINQDVREKYSDLEDYSEKFAIIKSLEVCANLYKYDPDKADKIRQELKFYKNTYDKNTQLQWIFKILVGLSYINKYIFFFMANIVFNRILRKK